MPGCVKKNMYYFQHNSDEILTFKNKSPTYVFTLLCFVLVLYMYIWWLFCTCLKEKAKNWLYLGGMHKPCGQPWGEGGSWNVHFTNKAYLVKLSTKGEAGRSKSKKKTVHMVCAFPLMGLQIWKHKMLAKNNLSKNIWM